MTKEETQGAEKLLKRLQYFIRGGGHFQIQTSQGFSQFGLYSYSQHSLLQEFSKAVHTSAQLLRTKVTNALSQTAISKNLIGPFECSRQKVCRRFKILSGLFKMLSVGTSPNGRDQARGICLARLVNLNADLQQHTVCVDSGP